MGKCTVAKVNDDFVKGLALAFVNGNRPCQLQGILGKGADTFL
jgi:hypothetical protein